MTLLPTLYPAPLNDAGPAQGHSPAWVHRHWTLPVSRAVQRVLVPHTPHKGGGDLCPGKDQGESLLMQACARDSTTRTSWWLHVNRNKLTSSIWRECLQRKGSHQTTSKHTRSTYAVPVLLANPSPFALHLCSLLSFTAGFEKCEVVFCGTETRSQCLQVCLSCSQT